MNQTITSSSSFAAPDGFVISILFMVGCFLLLILIGIAALIHPDDGKAWCFFLRALCWNRCCQASKHYAKKMKELAEEAEDAIELNESDDFLFFYSSILSIETAVSSVLLIS